MKREQLEFNQGRVDVIMEGNLIYLRASGEWVDEDADAVTRYLESYFSSVEGPTIRVWDASAITSSQFRISALVVSRMNQWALKIKQRWPGSAAYFIGPDPLVFGISRMYEIRTSDELMQMHVLHSLDELPDELRERISGLLD